MIIENIGSIEIKGRKVQTSMKLGSMVIIKRNEGPKIWILMWTLKFTIFGYPSNTLPLGEISHQYLRSELLMRCDKYYPLMPTI